MQSSDVGIMYYIHISQTHANGCDFMASIFYFYIEAIF